MFSNIYLKQGIMRSKLNTNAFIRKTFEFETYTPFELTNSPLTSVHLLNNVFNKYLNKSILIFIDDILNYSKD